MLLKSIGLLVAKSSKQCMQSFGDWPVFYGKYLMTKQVVDNLRIRDLRFWVASHSVVSFAFFNFVI